MRVKPWTGTSARSIAGSPFRRSAKSCGGSERTDERRGLAFSERALGRPRDQDAVAADQTVAAGDERPAARIVRDHEHGDSGSERQRDLAGVRPFVGEDEGRRRAQRRRVSEVRSRQRLPASHRPRPDEERAATATRSRPRRKRRRRRRREAQRRRRPSGARSGRRCRGPRPRRPSARRRRTSRASSSAAGRAPPHSGVRVNTTIGGRARQRRNSRRSSPRFRQAATRPIASGAASQGDR